MLPDIRRHTNNICSSVRKMRGNYMVAMSRLKSKANIHEIKRTTSAFSSVSYTVIFGSYSGICRTGDIDRSRFNI